MRPRLVIVSPASASENNGNWQTASRWARFLRAVADVTIVRHWHAGDPAPDLLIALHARRSADALAAFVQAYPQRPAILVLTGTDLYRDIATDPVARRSLDLAHALVLLQPAGLSLLPAALHARTHVIYQSARALAPDRRPHKTDVCMIGHLRDEKDPLTFMRAAPLVTQRAARLLHIGAALDPQLALAATDTEQRCANYRWLGALPRAAARQRLKRCRAMAIASRMEGGANVIIEAVTSGVPVLASAIDGNRGMLGDDYTGYFAPGDAAALAALIDRCLTDAPWYATLRAQCDARAALFTPQAEQAALRQLVDNLLRAVLHDPTTRLETT